MKKEIYIFIIAFSCRFAIFLALIWWGGQAGFAYPLQGGDATGYWNLARNIVTEREFYTEDERFISTRRPPGYPAFLAPFHHIFGNTTIAQYIIVLTQAVLVAMSAVLLYRLLRSFTSNKIAWLASVFFVLEPNSAYYSVFILSDALFVFLFIASVYIFITKQTNKMFFLSGVFMGLAMLVRPIAQFFPLIAVIFLFYKYGLQRRVLVQSGAFLLGAMLFTIPWMTHNNRVAGSFDLSSSGPATYYKYVLPHFVAWHTEAPYEQTRIELISNYNNAIEQGYNVTNFMQNELTRIIAEAPASYVVFHIVKTAPFFFGDGIREILQKTNILNEKQPNISLELLQGNFKKVIYLVPSNKHLLLAVLGGVFWSIILLLAVIGFWHGIHNKSQRSFALFFAVTIIYLALLTGPATSTRHRMPALPFIAGLAAVGYYALADRRTLNHTKYISSPESVKTAYPPQT